jgi:hypothetical protein
MRIRLESQVAIALEACAVQVFGQEFSGFGMVHVDREKEEFVIYDFIPLDVGTKVFTEIMPEQILKIINEGKSADLRCWAHRHPVGDGIPGPHNWSGTDNATIYEAPLGGLPELVGWSISIVRTPKGWVGRVDNHKTKKTEHLEVVGQAPRELVDQIDKIYRGFLEKSLRPFRETYETQTAYDAEISYPGLQPSLFEEDEDGDWRGTDWEEDEEDLDVFEDIAVTNFAARLISMRSEIDRANSPSAFEHVEGMLVQLEDDMYDTFGSVPPAPFTKQLAAMKKYFQEIEQDKLLEEWTLG